MNMSSETKMHSILVNAVVFKDDRVLVSQRSFEELHEPGKWTIPGGKVEKTDKETFSILEKSLAREVKEETGIDIENEIKLVANNTFIRSSDKQHVIVLVFKCKYKKGTPKPLEDTIDCKWVTLDDVKKMKFAPNVQRYILESFELSD